MPETIDVEEDLISEGWAVAPTEACSFVAIAVFTERGDAETFRARQRRRGVELSIVPAKAKVIIANTHDVKAGREALSKEDP